MGTPLPQLPGPGHCNTINKALLHRESESGSENERVSERASEIESMLLQKGGV